MFLTHANAMWTEAVRSAFAGPNSHPVLRDQDLWVGGDYPASRSHYPGIWTEFSPNGSIRRAGIAHVEHRDVEGSPTVRECTRWRFSGTLTATVVALTRVQRDELLDEFLRSLAFASERPDVSSLRVMVEHNDLIRVQASWEDVSLTGMASGTSPWGTDDLVWEGTYSLVCEGDFVSDLASEHVLVPLDQIVVVAERDDTPGAAPATGGADGGWM